MKVTAFLCLSNPVLGYSYFGTSQLVLWKWIVITILLPTSVIYICYIISRLTYTVLYVASPKVGASHTFDQRFPNSDLGIIRISCVVIEQKPKCAPLGVRRTEFGKCCI